MEKLGRFVILAIIYILLICFSLLIIPSVSWLFGGEFISVLQHPGHIAIMLTLSGIIWGVVFNDCFDGDFLSK